MKKWITIFFLLCPTLIWSQELGFGYKDLRIGVKKSLVDEVCDPLPERGYFGNQFSCYNNDDLKFKFSLISETGDKIYLDSDISGYWDNSRVDSIKVIVDEISDPKLLLIENRYVSYFEIRENLSQKYGFDFDRRSKQDENTNILESNIRNFVYGQTNSFISSYGNGQVLLVVERVFGLKNPLISIWYQPKEVGLNFLKRNQPKQKTNLSDF